MPRVLHLCFTIDCEQLHEDYQKVSLAEGPVDWQASEGALNAFAALVEERHGVATFYVVPRAAAEHGRLLREIESRGHEVGLHLHPCVFEEVGRYSIGTAARSREEQAKLLRAARDRWAEAIGAPPITFRAGNFSANSDTFSICAELGMRHGSVSSPGRDVPEIAAVWKHSPVWPTEREGFIDVPLTTMPSEIRPNGFPLELRIEQTGDSPDDMPLRVLRSRLAEIASWPPESPRVLVALTHTSVPYHLRPARELAVIDRVVEESRRWAVHNGYRLALSSVGDVVRGFNRFGFNSPKLASFLIHKV